MSYGRPPNRSDEYRTQDRAAELDARQIRPEGLRSGKASMPVSQRLARQFHSGAAPGHRYSERNANKTSETKTSDAGRGPPEFPVVGVESLCRNQLAPQRQSI